MTKSPAIASAEFPGFANDRSIAQSVRSQRSRTMTPSELAAKMDHTILKPESTATEVEKVAREGVQYKFASICIAPAWVKTVAGILKGSGVKTCTVAGFPHGTSKPM